MCGVVALKPTESIQTFAFIIAYFCILGRLIVNNTHPGVPGRGRLALSFGFFTKNVDEQIYLLSLIFGDDVYRALCPKTSPLKLNNGLLQGYSTKKLKIGYFTVDGFLIPVPACKRAVLQTVEKLKNDGHELIEFKIPKPELMAEIICKNIALGGEYLLNLYKNDVVDEYFKKFVLLLRVGYLFFLIFCILGTLFCSIFDQRFSTKI